MTGDPQVASVSASPQHGFSKQTCDTIELVEGFGVAEDAHGGQTVQHLSRIRVDPTQPNLRQVHLIHAELFDDLEQKGFQIRPGDLGENILTRGIDLLGLPEGTLLTIGGAEIRITGLRNPCKQIEAFMPGLLAEMIERREDGSLFRKCGMMGVVEQCGRVAKGQAIAVTYPQKPHHPLEPV
ncbi:MOSC domain-containing protein [Alteriqipengyuania sp.]|uniref:MOSC domain-containing protein n=1 Tax=Alteriqipengyuania sp. TaxID=2800692 RepID=UPI003513CFB8